MCACTDRDKPFSVSIKSFFYVVMYDIITVIKKNMMKMFTVKYTFGTIITIIIYNSPHILFAAYIKYC